MRDYIVNKKAELNYHIEERLEAGIVLEGWEVKGILAKKLNLDNAFIKIKGGEAFLVNAQIAVSSTVCTHYQVEPARPRKLLLHRREISRLIGKAEEKGYTLIPLKVYQDRKIKLLVGVGKGKKLHDKRQDLKDKDWARQKEQLLKQANRE